MKKLLSILWASILIVTFFQPSVYAHDNFTILVREFTHRGIIEKKINLTAEELERLNEQLKKIEIGIKNNDEESVLKTMQKLKEEGIIESSFTINLVKKYFESKNKFKTKVMKKPLNSNLTFNALCFVVGAGNGTILFPADVAATLPAFAAAVIFFHPVFRELGELLEVLLEDLAQIPEPLFPLLLFLFLPLLLIYLSLPLLFLLFCAVLAIELTYLLNPLIFINHLIPRIAVPFALMFGDLFTFGINGIGSIKDPIICGFLGLMINPLVPLSYEGIFFCLGFSLLALAIG